MRPSILLPVLIAASPALAAEGEQPAGPATVPGADDRDTDIVVIATRIAGQVDTDIPPVMTLDEADIEAYGASSLGELLEAVSPQTGSGRGRGGGHPVILLNGQRISGFRQLREIPPEAIRRMEVLPEEVALRFGFPPDQRVVNFIMKDKFASLSAAGEYNEPTRGGFAESELEAGLVRFDGPSRFNLKAKLEDATLLTEAERGIVQAADTIPDVADDPDPARFRSLSPDSVTRTVNGSWSTGLGDKGLGGSFAVDGEISRTDSRSLSGLDTVQLTAPDGTEVLRSLPGALERELRTDNFELGLTLNKPVANWQLTATANTTYTDTKTRTDREADLSLLQAQAQAGLIPVYGPLTPPPDPGRDRARTKLLTLSTFAGLSGTAFRLPAGEVSVTLDAGYDHLDNRNSDTRSPDPATKLSRDIASAGANIALPLTGGRAHFADALGDVSLNFSGDIHHFSDFGTLYDWSAGVIWSPADKLTFNASYIVSEVAPSVGQLGNPEIATFNVPVYDFTLGEAALVTLVSGGNPALRAEKQRDIKLSANYELPIFDRSRLIIEYFRNRSDDVTRSFPLLTPTIEVAFPDRVTRDAGGSLVAIDSRPVTFLQVETEHLRWGLNLSGRIGKQDAARQGQRGGGSPFGRGRHGGGRWSLAVYHTWRFADQVTIAPGTSALNQLAGDSLSAGGVPRHEVELDGGVFYEGFGVRFNGHWRAPARVLASGGPGSADLRFGSVTLLDVRLFVNFDRQPKAVEKLPWLKGVRVALDFDNVFDSRQIVTDGEGLVPLAYQAGYRDPRGRFAGIDIRKRF